MHVIDPNFFHSTAAVHSPEDGKTKPSNNHKLSKLQQSTTSKPHDHAVARGRLATDDILHAAEARTKRAAPELTANVSNQ